MPLKNDVQFSLWGLFLVVTAAAIIAGVARVTPETVAAGVVLALLAIASARYRPPSDSA